MCYDLIKQILNIGSFPVQILNLHVVNRLFHKNSFICLLTNVMHHCFTLRNAIIVGGRGQQMRYLVPILN